MNIEGVKVTKIIEYYVEGHTGKAYVNYLHKNLQEIERILLLKHNDPIFISAICKRLMKEYDLHQIEVIKSMESKDIIEGIIIRNLSLSILNDRIYEGKNQDQTII